MELSRRDVVLAALAVFVAWGYLTHWVPSLRFLPYAFVAGVILTVLGVLWAILLHSKPVEAVDLTEYYGPQHAAFTEPKAWQAEVIAWKTRSAYQPKPIYPPSLAVSHSVDKLLGLLLRDFVVSWYSQISPRPAFKNEVDKVIRIAMGNIVDKLLNIDIVGAAVSRIIPIMTAHMHEFYEAEKVVRGSKLTRNLTESEDLDLAIAAKFRQGNLHKAASLAFADPVTAQQHYLRTLIVRLLPQVLPPSALTSSGVTVLVKEIVACAVLTPSMKLLADPDTWHQLLENYGRTVLQDRKNVRRLRAALEEHAPSVQTQNQQTTFPKLQAQDNERKYEKFVRAIRKCNTLSDARRFRSEIAIQLRKEQGLQEQNQLYLRRLETGKRLLDRRIAELGAVGSSKVSKRKNPPLVVDVSKTRSRYDTATLRDILYDASGLSYFMEFMDRQHLMSLVQLWIVVDGFRNPLEDDNDDTHDFIQSAQAWTFSDRNDIAQINEGYLSRPEIKVAPFDREDIKTFIRAGKNATNAQYQAARKAVLRTQTAAYEEMFDPHFQNFKRSDMWFKLLASTEDTVQSPVSAGSYPDSHDEQSNPESTRPKTSRAVTAVAISRRSDLRRAIVSSADLKDTQSSIDNATRRSLDSNHSSTRQPLFADDLDPEPMTRSIGSLDSDRDRSRQRGDDRKTVVAMQAALNNIMDERQDDDKLFADSTPQDSLRNSMELPRPASGSAGKMSADRPSIASLGLVHGPSRRGVFEDDLFGDEAPRFPEDDKDDDSEKEKEEDVIHEAAPGDLGLAEVIDGLTLDIEKLVAQESIIDTLTKKAELTNNSAELRILAKSKSSLQREISRKELQRQQYIIQESDNSLYGRASISIKSVMVGTEQDGRDFAVYIIEVTRQAGDNMPAAVWVVGKRYSEFHELNKHLKARYPQIKQLDFPRRQMPVLKLQKDFLEKRRTLLEKYLSALLQNAAICRSRELRAFLSQQALPSGSDNQTQVDSRDFVSRIYNSVTDGMEEFLGNIPVLDQLSLAGQNLITAAQTQLNATAPNGKGDEVVATAEAEAEIAAFETRELEPFVKPICDLFLETFELNRENNWLRGRAVVLVLQQLLGGTVERKVRDSAGSFLSGDGLSKIINIITDMVWPDGGARIQPKPRTAAQKTQSKKEAGAVLATLIPELVGSVVGRQNAQSASRRLLAMLNNERLNTHLAYTLLDEILNIVFSDGAGR